MSDETTVKMQENRHLYDCQLKSADPDLNSVNATIQVWYDHKKVMFGFSGREWEITKLNAVLAPDTVQL